MNDHSNNFDLDFDRQVRTHIDEIIYAEGKQEEDLRMIIQAKLNQNNSVLVSRVQPSQLAVLHEFNIINHDRLQRTFTLGSPVSIQEIPIVGIVTAGTSDFYLAEEVSMVLNYHGINTKYFLDQGVANLQRTQRTAKQISEDATIPIVIAIAGFEGAIFTVLSSLLSKPLIALPSSIGYGVNKGGLTALHSALGNCAPGVLTTNVDNAVGAAGFVIKLLKSRI